MDLHVHSTCSADGASTAVDLARRAAALGLAEIGFAEHADFDPRDPTCGALDLKRYDRELRAAREAVPGVRLRQGVEVTYQASREEEIDAWLAGHRWDYVLLSVHLVDYDDGWAILSEPPGALAYFATHSQRQAYAPYFQEVLRAAESGLGDVLGHLDLVKRYGCGPYGALDPSAFGDEIRAILRALVQRGTGLEINTSGWRQDPGEPYPALTVVRWYRELGGEVLTVGSDAHGAGLLAAGIPQALELARAAGFRAVTTFEERRPRWVDID